MTAAGTSSLAVEHVYAHPDDEEGYRRLATELQGQGEPLGELMVLWPQAAELRTLRRRETCLLSERRDAIYGGLARWVRESPQWFQHRWRRGFLQSARISSNLELLGALCDHPAGMLLEELFLVEPDKAQACLGLLAERAPRLRRLIIGRSFEELFAIRGSGSATGKVTLAGIDRLEHLRRLSVSGTEASFEGARLERLEELELITGGHLTETLQSLLSVPRPGLKILGLSAPHFKVTDLPILLETRALPALSHLRLLKMSNEVVQALQQHRRFELTILEVQKPPFTPFEELLELPLPRGAEDAAAGGRRNPDLERRLLADPEAEQHYQAYADWLAGEGDPRGELMRMQLAEERLLEAGEKAAALQRRCREHLDAFGHSLRVAWRRGLIDGACCTDSGSSQGSADYIEALYSRPSGRYLRSLELIHNTGGDPYTYQPALAALVAHATPALARLTIQTPGASGFSELGAVRGRCPGLRQLRLRGELQPGELAGMAGAWPNLVELELDLHGTPFWSDEPQPRASELKPLLTRENLPALGALTLERTGFDDELVGILEGSGLLERLTLLKIGGCLSPEAAARLLDLAPPACRVVVSRYRVSPHRLTLLECRERCRSPEEQAARAHLWQPIQEEPWWEHPERLPPGAKVESVWYTNTAIRRAVLPDGTLHGRCTTLQLKNGLPDAPPMSRGDTHFWHGEENGSKASWGAGRCMIFSMRNGLLDGESLSYDAKGALTEIGWYEQGHLVEKLSPKDGDLELQRVANALRASLGPRFTEAKNDYYAVGVPRVIKTPEELAAHEQVALLRVMGPWLDEQGQEVSLVNAFRETDDHLLTRWELKLHGLPRICHAFGYHLGDNLAGFILEGETLIAEISDGDIIPPRPAGRLA